MTNKNKISFATKEDFEKEFFVNKPEAIRAFLNVALEDYLYDHNKAEFFQALALAMKWAKVSNVATKAQLTRQGVYKAIRPNSNPSFTTVISMLQGAGFGIKITKA